MIIYFAALSMIFQDLFEAMKDQAQNRDHPFYAGLFDSLMYLAWVPSAYVAVTIWSSHSVFHEVYALSLITLANFIGQGVGVLAGQKLIKE